MNQQVTLEAVINISPSGNSSVEFIEESCVTDIKLIKIALLYAVKIAYLLESESAEITEAYKNLIGEIVKPSEWSPVGKMTERLSEMSSLLQEEDTEPSAVAEGERFSISLIEGSEIDSVNTEIPNPGFVANLPISVILLSDAVARRLHQKMVEVFENQFRFVTREIFRNSIAEINDLKRFNNAITNTLNFAGEITDVY